MTEPVAFVGGGTARIDIDAALDEASLATLVARLLASDVSRVEAHIGAQNRAALRAAARAGMRREGTRRTIGPDGHLDEHIVVARLATDPDPGSGPGFRAVLNAGLNRTRVIAQGLARNADGAVLLCELTYKRYWDLPGGVVDPHESPASALGREIREETGIEPRIGDLLAVNWLPPWQGWDDACLFVFAVDLPDDVVDRARLEPREIAALHWCMPGHVAERVADYTARLLDTIATGAHPPYLEDGLAPRADG